MPLRQVAIGGSSIAEHIPGVTRRVHRRSIPINSPITLFSPRVNEQVPIAGFDDPRLRRLIVEERRRTCRA